MSHAGSHRRHLPVFDNIRQRLPPEFIQTDVAVGEHQKVALALGGAEVAGARHADAGSLDRGRKAAVEPSVEASSTITISERAGSVSRRFSTVRRSSAPSLRVTTMTLIFTAFSLGARYSRSVRRR